MTKTNYGTIFKNGIFGENPVFRLALSLCPAVAVTSGVKNGFLMGVAVLFVMTMVNATVSLLRKFINPKVRIPSYMFIIAFAIVLSRAEMFASRNKFLPSVVDGASMGLWFLLALVLLGIFREFLGKGSLWGHQILWADGKPVKPMLIAILPTGGFFAMGLVMGG